MNSEPESVNRPAWLRFSLRMLILLGMVVLQNLVFSALGLILASSIFGLELNELGQLLSGDLKDQNYVNALKFIHSVTAFGMFILPGIMFARMDGQHFGSYFGVKRVLNFPVWLIFIAAALACTPFISGIDQLNHQLQLPQFLAELQEKLGGNNKAMTEAFLQMPNEIDLLVNLLIFGLLAGLGEEIIFRGLLQRGIHNWLGNGHAAVWIAAAIFSFVHFDFQSFLPRLFLGALLGYAYWRSGNILLPAFLHFLNNSLAVLGSWFEQKGHSISYLEENFVFPTEWVILSGIILLAGIVLSIFLTRKDEHALDEAL